MRGPIDYIVVGFVGNKFNGGILKALENAIDDGVIALIALLFIMKDKTGDVTTLGVTESEDADVVAFAEKYQVSSDLIASEDIDEVADMLEDDTSAGLLVIEQLWAKPLKKALLEADGFLLAEGRIHPEASTELEDKEEE